ncbi:MAG TPA: class I SAM-dependent methyltransferase family protein [Candidatus Atribacteria bacterium]|nr:class I SAM-dependent methyltransferase family protein [Candidatus Atribacteria bacterium]
MMTEAIKVRSFQGKRAVEILGKLNLIHRGKKIKKSGDFILIPLIRRPNRDELNYILDNLGDVNFCVDFFEDRSSRPRSLVDALIGLIPNSKLELLPRSFDVIGDVAIIEIPPELSSFKRIIGEALMRIYPRIKAVFAKKSAVSGVFRVRELEHVAGVFSSITLHREYGCIFKVDVLNVYFSPRLSFERYRVARQVEDGEVVVDMFTGVGPFSIMIAKYSRANVFSIDINPRAISLLSENLKLNKLRGFVYPILADANYVLKLFRSEEFADRVVMNLPENSYLFLDKAIGLVKSGGVIHYYCFSGGDDPIMYARLKLIDKLRGCDISDFSIIHMRKVKPIAPYKWQIAIDFKVFK